MGWFSQPRKGELRLCMAFYKRKDLGLNENGSSEYEVALITTAQFGSRFAKGTLYYPGYREPKAWDNADGKRMPTYLSAITTVYYPDSFEKILRSVPTGQRSSFLWASEVISTLSKEAMVHQPVSMVPTADKKAVNGVFWYYKTTEADFTRRK